MIHYVAHPFNMGKMKEMWHLPSWIIFLAKIIGLWQNTLLVHMFKFIFNSLLLTSAPNYFPIRLVAVISRPTGSWLITVSSIFLTHKHWMMFWSKCNLHENSTSVNYEEHEWQIPFGDSRPSYNDISTL